MTTKKPFAVVICGGGTAGIEALLRLRRLAGNSVEVTLLCPQEQLFYRPDAVLQPFTLDPMRPYPIRSIAADTGPRHLVLHPGGTQLYPDRTVTLPTITGPNIRGIPGGAMDRFVSVDAYCRVLHSDGRIFAAGDATSLPLKHGGIGAQQGDTVAAGIAHLAGAAGPAAPLRPVIRGELLTAGSPLYLSAHLSHDDDHADGSRSEVYDHPPWLEDEELVAAELAPYLRGLRNGAATDQTRSTASLAQSATSGRE